MALTQITTDGIKDGTITGTDLTTNVDFVDNQKLRLGTGNDLQIYHDGSNSFIDDSGTGNLVVRSSTIAFENAPGGAENLAKFIGNGAVELYYDNSKKIQTASDGVQWFGKLKVADGSSSSNLLTFGDNADLQIYHNGTHSFIDNNTGDLYIGGNFIGLMNSALNEWKIKAFDNGAVELYYDGSKKLETWSGGAQVHGSLHTDELFLQDNEKIKLGTGSDLQIYHDGSDSYIKDSGTGKLRLLTDSFRVSNAADSENLIAAEENGAVSLFYDNTLRFSTNNPDNSGNRFYGSLYAGDGVPIYLGNANDLTLLHDGTDCRIRYNHTVGELKFQLNNNNTVASFNTSGHFVAGSNNTYDLGTSSVRWRNIYTNDLNLSNEGGANDVDGTWGSYTIQEGAEDLFLVNKRNGKKYKFALTEVS